MLSCKLERIIPREYSISMTSALEWFQYVTCTDMARHPLKLMLLRMIVRGCDWLMNRRSFVVYRSLARVR